MENHWKIVLIVSKSFPSLHHIDSAVASINQLDDGQIKFWCCLTVGEVLFIEQLWTRWLAFTLDFKSISQWYKQSVMRGSEYEWSLGLYSNSKKWCQLL